MSYYIRLKNELIYQVSRDEWYQWIFNKDNGRVIRSTKNNDYEICTIFVGCRERLFETQIIASNASYSPISIWPAKNVEEAKLNHIKATYIFILNKERYV